MTYVPILLWPVKASLRWLKRTNNGQLWSIDLRCFAACKNLAIAIWQPWSTALSIWVEFSVCSLYYCRTQFLLWCQQNLENNLMFHPVDLSQMLACACSCPTSPGTRGPGTAGSQTLSPWWITSFPATVTVKGTLLLQTCCKRQI